MTENHEHGHSTVEQERQQLRAAKARGFGATLLIFTKLSGPGWLQSAITLGGGSLASSLYLGVLAGFGMLWLQPIAMILGIAMLSCIAFVTLSTGERPFRAINRHINPVLGWAWAIASLMANMVWSLPQFALANGVIQQNLAPGLLGGGAAKVLICIVILALTVGVTWCYGNGSRGIKLYEGILKLVVAMIVLSFVGVVFKLGFSKDGLPWADILKGFVPDLGRVNTPAPGFEPLLGSMSEDARQFWTHLVVDKQRDVMISAAATAVGINMTFLMGYLLLAKGWDREFRGLCVFDLATGMFIPFVLATSCVVIASANQFHLEPAPGLLGGRDAPGQRIQPAPKAAQDFNRLIHRRSQAIGAGVSEPEKRLAAMLANRDVKELALSLEPLTGGRVANLVFGVGVLAMALSTITILMLISGFVICEMFDLPRKGWPFKLGCLAACSGVFGPFLWGQASAYLAVPTSVFGMVLLPLAYISFFLMMNQKTLLKENLPTGIARVLWNVILFIAAGTATLASLFVIRQKAGWKGLAAVGVLLALVLLVHIIHKPDRERA